jgi:hypothetical protein
LRLAANHFLLKNRKKVGRKAYFYGLKPDRKEAQIRTYCAVGVMLISTRRFWARPSGVALLATGWLEP